MKSLENFQMKLYESYKKISAKEKKFKMLIT
jgi:hypothetical protein